MTARSAESDEYPPCGASSALLAAFLRALATLCILISALPAHTAHSIVIGVLAHRPAHEVAQRWHPLAAYLQEELGKGITVRVIALPYDELEAALARQQIDFALTNPSHFIALRNRNPLSGALVTLVPRAQGSGALNSFGGVIIVHPQREDLRTLGDLVDVHIAAVGPFSLGGYQAQAARMVDSGLPLPAAGRLSFVGTPHDRVVDAVLGGHADAGFVRSGVIEGMIAEGRLSAGAVRVLAAETLPGYPHQLSTRLYPEWPLFAAPHVNPDTARRVAAALLLLDADSPVAQALDIHGFSAAADYEAVERLLRSLRLPPFDGAPQFTWHDVWQRYLPWLLAFALSLALLSAAGFRTALLKRRHEQTQRHLAATLNAIPDLLFEVDGDERFIGVHTADPGQLYAPAERFLGCTVAETLPAEVAAVARQAIQEARLRGRSQGHRYALSTANGLRHFELCVARKEGSASTSPSFVCIARDISEAHQTTEALRRERDLFSTGPVVVLNWAPDLSGRVLAVSSNVGAVLGYSAAELCAANVRYTDLIHPDDVIAVTQELQACMNAGPDHFEQSYRLRTGSGEYRWFHDATRISRNRDGAVDAIRGYLFDQTWLKTLELERDAQAAALAKSNAELEQFAYVASHDLRQPLRMITSYAQLLEQELGTTLSGDTRRMLDFVAEGATRMDEMLVSLLEYSRVGRSGAPLSDFPVREALEEAIRFLEPAIAESAAAVEISGEWPHLHACRNELVRLFQNLLGNAIKYRRAGEAPEVHIDASAHPQGWLFSVSDNGIGIEPAQRERLFRVFQRLHTRTEYEGNGIGLAISRKIVERHGGRIWIEAGPGGRGSRFLFILAPRANPTPN
ncbi:PhnD/SsuA/transferrin family substrate-binding protein [Pseudothauera lacus]|uniref:histidine kinase n=1 Tax=Pseudothauera lacus TaxID=2136175 RepID=A0A2T4IGY7_9RHOO|nr:PhnD/SsuA/transferrin family substrate-binding protein [Pseudothauera lacus]PTD97021.1 hypothetical protein C8261_06400 [Pseudothauera lacus]